MYFRPVQMLFECSRELEELCIVHVDTWTGRQRLLLFELLSDLKRVVSIFPADVSSQSCLSPFQGFPRQFLLLSSDCNVAINLGAIQKNTYFII